MALVSIALPRPAPAAVAGSTPDRVGSVMYDRSRMDNVTQEETLVALARGTGKVRFAITTQNAFDIG